MKKKAFYVAFTVLFIVYGIGTWYTGWYTQKHIAKLMADIQSIVGETAKVSYTYERSFFQAEMQTMIEWDEPIASERGAFLPADGGANRHLQVVISSAIRHGPVAGWKTAMATIESQVIRVNGLDAATLNRFTDISSPILTVIFPLTGGQDVRLIIPKGEFDSTKGEIIRWDVINARLSLNADSTNIYTNLEVGSFYLKIPRENLSLPIKSTDENYFEFLLNDLNAEKYSYPEEGVWLISPGKLNISLKGFYANGKTANSSMVSILSAENFRSTGHVAQKNQLMNIAGKVVAQGSIGSIVFDEINYHGSLDKIHVGVISCFQSWILNSYFSKSINAVKRIESVNGLDEDDNLKSSINNFFASVPSYEGNFAFRRNRQNAALSYKLALNTVPDEGIVQSQGYVAALMKTAALNASVKLPREWGQDIAGLVLDQQPEQSQMDAILSIGQSQNIINLDKNSISSTVYLDDGKFLINGKLIDFSFEP